MDGQRDTDVVVVGAGNAALCAALAASEGGASVIVLESAPEPERGGNTAYTAGAMRVVYNGVEDLKALMPDLSESEIEDTDFGEYSAEQFIDDMARVTEYRADPDLVELLVMESYDTLRWMQSHGVRFMPLFGRQAFEVDGRFSFWGGMTVEVVGGGPGLVDALVKACEARNITIEYETRAVGLLADAEGVHGVKAHKRGGEKNVFSKAVVLACGGFEANAEWRARYLGPGWDLAHVRGTRFNTGDGIRMALEVGASPKGNWSGCHAVQWDRNSPEFGDLAVGDGFQKHSYPFGILVNNLGKRFVDEGADFRNYTYAKYGHEVLRQPGQTAWQIFDQKASPYLRDEYRIAQATRVRANALDKLAEGMPGVDSEAVVKTVEEFNAAIDRSIPFDPNRKDGRKTIGLEVPKSNWAVAIDEPPFEAYQVTCGITFTFGGLRTSTQGEVIDTSGSPIPGLYAAGEIVGGLFYFNYPGGTGLTSGSVFGRSAGRSAARESAGA